jgi:hypothetical protein
MVYCKIFFKNYFLNENILKHIFKIVPRSATQGLSVRRKESVKIINLDINLIRN